MQDAGPFRPTGCRIQVPLTLGHGSGAACSPDHGGAWLGGAVSAKPTGPRPRPNAGTPGSSLKPRTLYRAQNPGDWRPAAGFGILATGIRNQET